MESSSLDGAFLSPESTVTSLLSSSGHLRSCLEVPEHNTTFRYKYKLYDSASAALNAYIADFNNSHLKEKLLTGNLNASHHFPSTPSRPRVARLKNHDVLREHLTDRELDFLRLPDNSHLQSVNQDRVSMTTDELLSIPYDGSMPVTHTSAFIQGLFSRLLDSQPSASSRPANRSWNRSHSMPTVPEQSQQHASPTRSFRSRRPQVSFSGGSPSSSFSMDTLSCICPTGFLSQSPHVVARSDRMEPSSSLHLPHWLTSNNSDMDSSEVSVPRLKYPPWIQCCDVSEPAGASETELWDRHAAASRLQAPSWVAELEDEEDPDGTISQVNGQQTLRNLRLQFAEQISLLAAERSSSSMKETLLRDNRMELLIQKADQVLNSLSRGCGAAEHPPDPADTSTQPFTQADVPPPDTHPPLCFSSSHCQQDSSEVAAGGTTTPLEVRELQAQPHYSHHGNNLLKQPGPAEALKQVLFRLQAVEAELQHHQQPKASLSPSVDGPLQQEAEPEPRPDGLSLQRALHHLTHLKALVEEPRKEPGKNDKEEVEKDEDEVFVRDVRMSKRGRRRSSKRRKSSGSKSTSPYNQQENRSCSYKDEMKKDQNVLSASENERKCKSEQEEGHTNLSPNPNVVYMKTTEDKENGMKITTSVSVSDMKHSFPKVTFQLSHELLSENPSLSEMKKRKSFGLNLKLEMKEGAELNNPALKSNFHFIYGEDCKYPPPDVESPEGPSQHSWTSRESHSTNQTQEQTSTMWKSPNVSQYYSQHHRHHPVVNISPLTMRKHIQRNVDPEKCQNVAPTEQRSAPVSPLRSAMLGELAFSRITQRLFHPAPNITPKTDGGTTFSGAPLFSGSEQHPGNISLVEDHSCPKRKSWIQNKDAEKRGCFFPIKRCNTFPGMSEALGMTREVLVSPYHGCVWSLIMNSLPFNTVRLGNLHQQKIHLSSFGSRKCQCPQSRRSSTSVPEIPKYPQDMKIGRLQPCGRQTVSRCPRENVELDRDDPEGKISEEADSGFCPELEGEHLSPEQLPEELHPPQRHSHTPMLCQPVEAGGQQDGASLIPHITAASDLTSGPVGSTCGQHLIPITVEPPHTFPSATSALSNQWSEETNDLLLDTEEREAEEKHKADISSAQDSTDKLDQKLPKVDETPRLSLDNSHHLRPVDSSVSDHWAAKRKLFKENKQWSSAGGSSIASDMTEEQACEDCPPVDMAAQDEDRGFYAETFYSSAWVYQGDDSPGTVPPSLNSRTRAVSIRERTVKISKGTGEYPWGFRIQFSKPIVVTEVDTNGAAEEAGLIVGDSVLAVNGTDVTSIPHSEAANLARQGPDLLTLTIGSDIARYPSSPRPACRGYLYKRTQSGLIKGWRKRWFVLTHECCLCYYRHRRDEGRQRPLHAVRLEGAEVRPHTSLGRPFVFKCCPQAGSRVFFFCATSSQEMKRWLEAMEKAIRPVTQTHVWEDVTRHNCSLPPLAVKSPECLGLLHKLDRSKDTWVQHYCILKDGCLSFYSGIRATHAQGGIYLQGYMVREQPYGSKKSSIELKPPSDEFKTFYFCAENATENKRWILALKASVKKWLPLHQALQDYMDQPPEETRM